MLTLHPITVFHCKLSSYLVEKPSKTVQFALRNNSITTISSHIQYEILPQNF